ncbi:hypothetical protein KC929_01295 [Patescibacteria group bacterium]|nr:hypothetical protein [Patescibacteria group bacterium]
MNTLKKYAAMTMVIAGMMVAGFAQPASATSVNSSSFNQRLSVIMTMMEMVNQYPDFAEFLKPIIFEALQDLMSDVALSKNEKSDDRFDSEKSDDHDGDIEIEVEIEGNKAKVKVDVDGDKDRFTLAMTNEDEIVAYIADKYEWTVEEVQAIIEFDHQSDSNSDDDGDDDHDDDHDDDSNDD